MSWAEWAERETAAIRGSGQWRAPRDLDAAGPEGKLAPDGRPVVTFASNDYLGLTQHPAVIAAAHAALDRWGAGTSSARLIVGSRPVHTELEAALAQWKRAETAVLFPTGFATNLGVLGTFGKPGVLVCSDELNHASIIDGCRLSGADLAVYRHRDVDHVDALLRDAHPSGRRAIVVTDTVFSMDGDTAPVDELAEICAHHGALLVLDEAHAVLGPDPDLDGVDALRIGTLSKTLGALGGFVAGPRVLTDLVVNRARSYIFTTASTPGRRGGRARGGARAALPGGRRARRTAPPRTSTGSGPVIRRRSSRSCSAPRSATLAAAAALLEQGMLVPAIRPPTVAPGSSRLRVTVSAAHTDAQVDALARALAEL